jgi:hypothetical protein
MMVTMDACVFLADYGFVFGVAFRSYATSSLVMEISIHYVEDEGLEKMDYFECKFFWG